MKKFLKLSALLTGLLILNSGWASGAKYPYNDWFTLSNYYGCTINVSYNNQPYTPILNNGYNQVPVPANSYVQVVVYDSMGNWLGSGNYPGHSAWAVQNSGNGKIRLVKIR